MGISSLGVGSSVLTQDVVDQLRASDEAQFITPVDKRMKAEKSKSAAMEVVDALMDNVYGSLKSLTEYGVFESRTATTTDDTVATVTANASSDIQDFSIEVANLGRNFFYICCFGVRSIGKQRCCHTFTTIMKIIMENPPEEIFLFLLDFLLLYLR